MNDDERDTLPPSQSSDALRPDVQWTDAVRDVVREELKPVTRRMNLFCAVLLALVAVTTYVQLRLDVGRRLDALELRVQRLEQGR